MSAAPGKWSADLSGTRFGSLRVVAFDGYRGTPTQHAHWGCECDCGRVRVVRATRLTRGGVTSCAECARARGAALASAKRRAKPKATALNMVIGTYRTNAAKRGLPFDLCDANLLGLFKSACFYCGSPPRTTRKNRTNTDLFVYNGIDRKENTLGYTHDNVVPCCAICNYAKREMGVVKFLAWVRAVYRHSCEAT